MLRIGLTGGIGSGKSTVAGMLASQGLPLVDADQISRAATQSQGAAIPAIRHSFGDTVIAKDGSLNRELMRQVILDDPTAKSRLEDILHPLIGRQIKCQLDLARATGAQIAILDIPLLVEGGSRWRRQLDAVWVVDCLPQTQVARVRARSGWPVVQIEAVMATQAHRMQRLACADGIIFNEDLELIELQHQVLRLLHRQMRACGR